MKLKIMSHNFKAMESLKKFFVQIYEIFFSATKPIIKDNFTPGVERTKAHEHLYDLEPRSVLDCYRILGLEQDKPSGKEVKLAYRKLIRIYHPDKVETECVSIKDEAHFKSRKINAAYEVLKRNGLVDMDS